MSNVRRTAFVTGASQGIGAAIAVALARDGFDVAVSSTRPSKLSDVLAKIQAAGARSAPVALDVRSQASIEKAMAEAVSALGPIDVLVNNAAVPLRKPALEIAAQEWDAVLSTGLTGTFFMCQQMGRHLVATGRPGCIISIASTHGLVAARDRSIYGIAKAGVIHMTRMLAIEWADHGIRVNAIAPGVLRTPMWDADVARGAIDEQFYIDTVPVHRLGLPSEVGKLVVFLSSDDAAYITGSVHTIDGALTAIAAG
jgi:NAD(P)-dependent dehydrogenase (short-subunit alcohol dehydrogenase family)